MKGTDAGTDTGCTRVYAVSHDEYSTVEFSGGETEAIGGETYYKTGAKFTLGHTEKTGYEFTGWTVKDIDGGDAAVDGGTFTLGEKDAVVSAVWKAVRYTLSYELGEGSAENPASYTIESPDFTLNAPTKAGQKFMGWTDTDLAGATVNVTITKGSTGNRTYTATWGEYPNTYSVSTPAGLSIQGQEHGRKRDYFMENPVFRPHEVRLNNYHLRRGCRGLLQQKARHLRRPRSLLCQHRVKQKPPPSLR